MTIHRVFCRSLRSRRLLSCLAFSLLLTPAVRVHAEDDAGVGAFFREQFGIGRSSETPTYALPDEDDRPLIVRPKRKRSSPRIATVVKGPVGPVSIYDDKTLRPGDAVMTQKGLRVFVGSRAMPHREEDFVAVMNADGLPKQVEKNLLAIERAPRI